MSINKLLQQTAPLKNESIDIQNAMRNFSSGLCREQFINPEGLELVTQLGHVTDNNNCEAISN